jgi:hypothetical protein
MQWFAFFRPHFSLQDRKTATKFVNKKGLENIGFKPGGKDLLANVKSQTVLGTVSPIF